MTNPIKTLAAALLASVCALTAPSAPAYPAQSIVIDNRPGSGGNIGTAMIAREVALWGRAVRASGARLD